MRATSADNLSALRLHDFPRRAALMAAAASLAAAADFLSKEVAVALGPEALLFNVLGALFTSADASLILVAATCSLLACVLPVRLVALGAGLALGGALGNLASRPRWWATYGGTPDFIPFGDGSTGNLADLFITAGAAAMVLSTAAWLVTTQRAARRSGT